MIYQATEAHGSTPGHLIVDDDGRITIVQRGRHIAASVQLTRAQLTELSAAIRPPVAVAKIKE